jgi:pyruvate,water dikinase
VTDLLAQLTSSATTIPDSEDRIRRSELLERQAEAHMAGWQRLIFREVLRLTRAYMRLREDQRFTWQKVLAYQRSIFAALGKKWAREGQLDRPEAIWCATLEEVCEALAGRASLPRKEIAARCAELHRLEDEHRRAPELTYPAFLHGNRPLVDEDSLGAACFHGLPVSPGVGSGPARVILIPSQFERIRPGDVLVTRGADPGWTPLFGILSGLILETGGQLSHGAVIAREYGLPAVAALPGITRRLKGGEMVTLDGRTGIVTVNEDALA